MLTKLTCKELNNINTASISVLIYRKKRKEKKNIQKCVTDDFQEI